MEKDILITVLIYRWRQWSSYCAILKLVVISATINIVRYINGHLYGNNEWIFRTVKSHKGNAVSNIIQRVLINCLIIIDVNY